MEEKEKCAHRTNQSLGPATEEGKVQIVCPAGEDYGRETGLGTAAPSQLHQLPRQGSVNHGEKGGPRGKKEGLECPGRRRKRTRTPSRGGGDPQ